MFITANRKDLAKCSHFIECFELDQIQQGSINCMHGDEHACTVHAKRFLCA